MMRRDLLISAGASTLSPGVLLGAVSNADDLLVKAVAGWRDANHRFDEIPNPTGEYDTAEHNFWRSEWERHESAIENLPIRSKAGLEAYCSYLMEVGRVFKISTKDLIKIDMWARGVCS